MNVCSNFQLSLTGGFQECRNCGREKKFHRLDFENNNIEYVQKASNNNAAKFQQDKLQQIATQKQVEEDEFRSKACSNFVLALTGQFQQCGNCKIEKKYHKLDTTGQIAYQPKSQQAKPVQQTQQQTKVTAVAEVVQETMMVQSVKDRIAQMNKKNQTTNEPQFRPSIKKEEVKEKVLGQAEIITEQVFTTVSDKKSVFDKQRVRKTIEQSTQQIREQQNTEGIRKAESQFISSQDNAQEQQEQLIQNQNPFQENNQEGSEENQQQEQQFDNNQDQQQQHQVEEQQQEQQQEQQEEQQQQQEQEQQEEQQQQEQQEEQQQQEQQEESQEKQQEVILQQQEQEESNNQNELVEQSEQQNYQQDEGQQDNQQQEEANNQDEAADIY